MTVKHTIRRNSHYGYDAEGLDHPDSDASFDVEISVKKSRANVALVFWRNVMEKGYYKESASDRITIDNLTYDHLRRLHEEISKALADNGFESDRQRLENLAILEKSVETHTFLNQNNHDRETKETQSL
jgi:hypothetical protein